MGGFGQRGFHSVPTHDYENGNRNGDDRPREFFHDKDCFGPDHKRRLLFLDGEDGMPFGFWMHAHYSHTSKKWIKEVCLRKNGIDSYCPICDHKVDHKDKKTGDVTQKNLLPSYVGIFSVLVMGIPEKYTDEKG